MPIQDDYLERLYAGFIGKNVGIRLGAPVEPAIWTYERIRNVYGEVRSYLKPYRNFAADDDVNGPVFFIRPLIDGDPARPLDPRDVGRAWLDYAREGVGMFWWGGYGRSTEHTAYLNLKAGVHAPESGSSARNGKTVANQIGGQIFIDTWGLVLPGRPDEAARYAATAASVSHDGEGLNGARFIAACIAAAFCERSAAEVVRAGLGRVERGSLYEAVIEAVIRFHDKEPESWRACQEYLIAEWGYDRYQGLCHVIPNAGVCALALLYGEGNFACSVEIATMCGWDTDCNAGNVGTIAGVLYGLGAIPERYRAPINDGIVLSSAVGSLNILDIPTFSRTLASIGYRLAGEPIPIAIVEALAAGDGESGFHFDFALPGSTHNLRVSDPVACAAQHRPGEGRGGKGALEFRFDRLERESSVELFYKPFYRRADFDDERYSPTFAPTVRPGQKARIVFRRECWEGDKIGVEGYVRISSTGERRSASDLLFPADGEECSLEFAVPDVGGSEIDEIGLRVIGFSGAKKRDSGRLVVDSFDIFGKARYAIDIASQSVEFGCVTPFSHDHGAWSIESGRLHLMSPEDSASYTGGHAVRDQRVSATVTPLAGDSHLLAVRCGGLTRGYFAGLDGLGRVSIYRKDGDYERLVSAEFAWKHGVDYQIALSATGERIDLTVNGEILLTARDAAHSAGMVGCGCIGAARALYGPFLVEEI
jgi:ADP-ribosylglycohydrolase